MLFKCACQQFRAHDMATHAAAVTFYILLSLFPFLIIFIALLGIFELSSLFEWLRHQSQNFFLPQTTDQMNRILDQLQQRRIGMLSFGVIAAVWVTSYGMLSIMNALNVVYGVQEERPLWKRFSLSLLYTLVVGTMLSLAATLALVNPSAMQKLAQWQGMERDFAVLWAWWLRWPVIVLLLTTAVALVYGIAPDAEQRFQFVTPGTLVAVTVLIGISLTFNYYIQNIVDIDALYGSVGTAIALLLYFFMSALVLLFGAEVNAAVERYAPAGKNPGDKQYGRT